jgi:BirA family transcriptional regulator, biotin operon repressor / biotin---[acetyl-CoA-carboxylase] ligase
VGAVPLVVLGLGVNVSQRPDDWPPELRGRAVSLAELGGAVARPALLAELLRRLAERYETYLASGESVAVLPPLPRWVGRGVAGGDR